MQQGNQPNGAAEAVKQGLWDEAIQRFSELTRGQSFSRQEINQLFIKAAKEAEAYRNLSSAELHCRLLAIAPNHSEGIRNFSVVLKRLGDYTNAEKYLRRYLSRRPSCIHGLNSLGTVLSDMGRHPEAVEAYERVLVQNPDHAPANANLANEYHLMANIDKAYEHSCRAVAGDPTSDNLWLGHLTHLRRVCDYARLRRIDWWKLLEKLPPESISSTFLQTLVLAEERDEQDRLRSLINSWGDSKKSEVNDRYLKEGRELVIDKTQTNLKIGFVSADFCNHSVARFIWPLFERLDRDEFSLFGYCTYTVRDEWRDKFEERAESIKDVAEMSPLELCNLIRADRIDILFDLTGFTRGSRTQVFAWRPAPVQISWLGFPGTTGIEEMDYILLDKYLKPKDEGLIREKPLLTNASTVCFSGIDEIPITEILPEEVRGYFTFGSLNNPYKFTERTIARWARVMENVENSKILLVRREYESYYLRKNITDMFGEFGVSSERIVYYNNRKAGRHYLDCYNEVDMSLDTYPVTGGTTTIDALWMGVPVIALEGTNIHQRVSSSILRHMKLDSWIAESDQDFIIKALDLCNDRELRRVKRQQLRVELQESVLCNTEQFCKEFAATMRSLKEKSNK